MTPAIHEVSDSKSHTSYKSTHSSRSSVLERAREYTRKMEDEASDRARSLERTPNTESSGTPRSSSRSKGNRMSSRERARASVERDSWGGASPQQPNTPQSYRTTDSSQQARSATPRQPSRPRQSRGEAPANAEPQQEAVVSPELLVDALSGHEDGLLAIAEKLMEHYDRGYDAMGEAIIDAFADVQKLFQHVVEAAHMEGAAFEASRREEEITELRRQAAAGGGLLGLEDPSPGRDGEGPASPTGPVRHDEFIDQDVKDCLSDAIRKGASLKDANKHMECYELYEMACQSASALLPVDSDHRGRLQLSIARAESMSPDRACAILRYAMDDVIRSGLRAGKVQLPDPSQRADVVLSKPKAHPSMNGSSGQAGVVQSSEEQLNSLVEEMKEILEAPVYKDTPLQDVAKRFWAALNDAQKQQSRNEERLEQSLGKLKGDFLLARAEWEEKLTRSEEQTEKFKHKYSSLKEGGPDLMEDARTMAKRMAGNMDEEQNLDPQPNTSFSSAARGRSGRAESIASLGSSMAQHAKTLVGQFACTGGGPLPADLEGPEDGRTHRHLQHQWRDRRHNSGLPTNPAAAAARSFREHSKANRGVDV